MYVGKLIMSILVHDVQANICLTCKILLMFSKEGVDYFNPFSFLFVVNSCHILQTIALSIGAIECDME